MIFLVFIIKLLLFVTRMIDIREIDTKSSKTSKVNSDASLCNYFIVQHLELCGASVWHSFVALHVTRNCKFLSQ